MYENGGTDDDDSTTRLDEVTVYGGKLRFLIPHEWVEDENETDSYLYHAPNTDSGWFRVSLITVKAVEQLRKRLQEMSSRFPSVNEETGNLIASSEKDTIQDGVPLHIYYWMVANAVPPDLIQEAAFSYTILADRRGDLSNERMVNILGQIAGLAKFGR